LCCYYFVVVTKRGGDNSIRKTISKGIYEGNLIVVFEKFDVKFFVLRNMVPAGVFVGTKKGLDALEINLDFAIPLYRDLRIGNYIFEENKDYFKKQGYTSFISYSTKPNHTKYLLKMGFELSSELGDDWYVKEV